ncbi:MAG: glutamine--tRNA ligase/YqeY domain fusion protein [Deltaproteobacteria bacterium]|nr:glutamine--tRNA ligase/YqeY domain fusion protein [Deltaproteobacteria bacterium]
MTSPTATDSNNDANPSNFIADIVDEDLRTGRTQGRVVTRFPPEPNGYLHIGHAKSICLNFPLSQKSANGKCHLRFDDTNPSTEDVEYVNSIQNDVKWMGFDWGTNLFFASDYFERLYAWAVQMIKDGKAYVDSQTIEQIRETRGNFYKPGDESPNRNRSVEENLDLFARMRAGEFPDGAHVLRAKIDMAHPNINMRDPLMYRIKHAHHHRTGDAWCIYPVYDWAHGQSDAIEGITHSICTLEFEDHRPLYEWYLEQLADVAPERRPRQIEFAKLNLTYTVLSKRRLQQMVKEGIVDGWDDPRMPTLAGLRRRGFTPTALRKFCDRIGVSKRDGIVDISLLEYALREDLNATSPRVFAVLKPLKVVIENLPEGHTETFDGAYNPEDPSAGSRPLTLTREVFIERDDFAEVPPKKWFRLAPGAEVRLRYACIIKCERVIKNDQGEVVELRCTWDPNSRGGSPSDGRKIRGTLHWVSATGSLPAQIRNYDRLFTVENPLDEALGGDFRKHLNPKSLEVLQEARVEPSLATAANGTRFQFERLGYYCVDSQDSRPDKLVFNRTITLKDSWSKVAPKDE